jgi:hypothetical protein
MQHYWGAKAICERLGYKAASRLPDLITRYRIPAYLRRGPNHKYTYYSNEVLLGKWELTRAQDQYERIKARQTAKQEAEERKSTYAFSR